MSVSAYSGDSGSHSVAEPYNGVLASQYLLEHTDATVVLESDQLSSVVRDAGCSQNGSTDNAAANALGAYLLSSMTLSLRFDGTLHQELSEFGTNLVPYPRLHFLTAALAPLSTVSRPASRLSVSEMTCDAFSPKCMLVGCTPNHGKYMACAVMYRGDVVPKDVMAAVATLKTRRDIQFVDWCPTGFKCGINYQQATFPQDSVFLPVDRSALVISNTTSISKFFSRLINRFDRLHSKRAFVHWFDSDGMEAGELSEARTDLTALERDYEEVGIETAEGETDAFSDEF